LSMVKVAVVTIDSMKLKLDKDYTYDDATDIVTFLLKPPRTSKVKIIVTEQ